MGKTDGKMLDDGQGKDGLETRLERHDNRPGVDQPVVVTGALAVQVG